MGESNKREGWSAEATIAVTPKNPKLAAIQSGALAVRSRKIIATKAMKTSPTK